MTNEVELDVEINTTVLKEFLNKIFALSIAKGVLKPVFGHNDEDATKINNELKDFGITTLADLNRIIPENFDEKLVTVELSRFKGFENFLGLIRSFMIITDADLYFKKVWEGDWSSFDETPIERLLGIDVEKFAKKYNIGEAE